MDAIEINNLTKNYGKLTALDNVSFNVAHGELFGVIGPDGAGKTTLFRLLTTLINPNSGTARIEGLDIEADYREIRKRVGYMPGKFSLYQDLSVAENIAFFAALFGVKLEDNYDLIEPIYKQIQPFRKRRAGNLSGGMKQKLALCCALIHRPQVLFLDEPTTGVDAVSRSEFWDMLSNLKAKGISMLVSTPYMDEARRCDRIALIDKGKILGIDTPEGTVKKYEQPLFALSGSLKMYELLLAARKLSNIEECYPFGATHHIVATRDFNPDEAVKALQAEGFKDAKIVPIEADIEDVFIRLMHHE